MLQEEKKRFKGLMLEAPDTSLDPGIKDIIRAWNDDFKAIDVLKAVDFCIHWGAASGFALSVLQQYYNLLLTDEGVTHSDMERLATWRNDGTVE